MQEGGGGGGGLGWVEGIALSLDSVRVCIIREIINFVGYLG